MKSVIGSFALILIFALGACKTTEESSSAYNARYVGDFFGGIPAGSGFSTVVTVDADNGEFKEISAEGPKDVEIEVVNTEADSNVHFAVSIVGESEKLVKDFSKSIQASNDMGVLNLKTQPGSYTCATVRNGDQITHIKGVCVEKIVFRIPANTMTSIYYNDTPIRLIDAMPVTRLMKALKDRSFAADKALVLRPFVNSRTEYRQSINADEVVAILATYSFGSEQVSALDQLAPAIDPETLTPSKVAQIIRRISFGNEKLSALQILAPRMRDRNDCREILSEFSFDSDKKSAVHILQSPQR